MTAEPDLTGTFPTGAVTTSLDAEIESVAIKAFVMAWKALLSSAMGALPSRQELQPRVIMPFMSSCWLYARDADGDFFCILTGDAVRSFWRAPTRGKYLRDFIPGGEHIAVQDRLSLAIDRQCLIHAVNRCAGKPHAVAERVYAPLAPDPDGTDYVFGCSDYHFTRDHRDLAMEQKVDTMRLFDCLSLAFVEQRMLEY